MVRKAGRIHASRLAVRFCAIAVPIVVLGLVPGSCAASNVGALTAMAAGMVGTQPQLVRLQAGTRIGETPPDGWNHVVLRSVPRLASGEWKELPNFANQTATLFRTAILADVQAQGLEKEFALTRVGLAMCVASRDGRKDDVVVSSDRLEALSIRLSTIEQMVLDGAEKELAEARIIAHTSTFALLRSPVTMLVGGKHHKVDLYYAFCVDPATGRLRVGLWSMWPGGVKQPPPPVIVELANNTVFDCELDAHANRLLGTVAYSWSFAICKLPPGHPIGMKGRKPLNDKIVAMAKHPSDVDTDEFEKMLRSILFDPKNVDQANQPRRTAKAVPARRAPAR